MEKVDELAFGVERLTGSPELPDKARYSRCWSFRQKTSIENTLRPPATSQHCTLGILRLSASPSWGDKIFVIVENSKIVAGESCIF